VKVGRSTYHGRTMSSVVHVAVEHMKKRHRARVSVAGRSGKRALQGSFPPAPANGLENPSRSGFSLGCFHRTKYCYDANGNVANLVDSSEGTVSATYEYSPFGEVVVSEGDLADVNPIRFSTKHTDDETGLVAYEYRYCAPSEARRFLRGVSLRRVRVSHPLVPSVGTIEGAEMPNDIV